MVQDQEDNGPRSIFAPRGGPEDDWRRLNDPGPPSEKPRRRVSIEAATILVCALLAIGAAAWSIVRRGGDEVRGERPGPAIVTLVAVPEGQSLQDICAAYGLPERLCDLSERCAVQAPRRDGRVALVLRSEGDDCGSPPP